MGILEFVQSKGWTFAGNCGCRNAMNMYRHPTELLYQGWEVWLSPDGKRLEIRRRFDQNKRSTVIKGIGTTLNFETVYYHHLPTLPTQ